MTTKYTKPSDKVHQETVQSQIIYAVWLSKYGPVGGKVRFEVRTSLVGEGAPIEITGESARGKKLGKIKDSIYRNRHTGVFDVPQKMDWGDQIYFEVELAKHKLKEESNRIPVVPPIVVKRMSWDKKEARRGDVVKMTVDFQDIPDGMEANVLIYEYDRDGNHDKITTIPTETKKNKIEILWEYEYHEDTDEIPEQQELQTYGLNYNPPEYFFVVEIDDEKFGTKQESGLLRFKDWIEVKLVDQFGEPVPGADYVVRLADGSEIKGKLDGSGQARVENTVAGPYWVQFPDYEET